MPDRDCPRKIRYEPLTLSLTTGAAPKRINFHCPANTKLLRPCSLHQDAINCTESQNQLTLELTPHSEIRFRDCLPHGDVALLIKLPSLASRSRIYLFTGIPFTLTCLG